MCVLERAPSRTEFASGTQGFHAGNVRTGMGVARVRPHTGMLILRPIGTEIYFTECGLNRCNSLRSIYIYIYMYIHIHIDLSIHAYMYIYIYI